MVRIAASFYVLASLVTVGMANPTKRDFAQMTADITDISTQVTNNDNGYCNAAIRTKINYF